MSYWSAALTKPNAERTALANAVAQGYVSYLPTIQYLPHLRPAPLFRRYLFVVIDDHWASLRSTKGIHSVILWGDRPARMPDHIIGALRRQESSDGVIRPQASPPTVPPAPVRYSTGMIIKVIAGPLIGQAAVFVKRHAARAIITIASMGIPADVSIADIAPA